MIKHLLTTGIAILGITISFAQSGRVGIGESSPGSKGSIKGNLSVGNNYSSQQAPANGAIIEGKTGIGVPTPDASAKLQIDATDAGILIPRMTTSQRDAIATPASGLLVYVTDNVKGFWYYDGSAWVRAIGPKGDTGNTGAAGAQGIQGVAGPAGAAGAQGLQGNQGIQGPQGAQGPTGFLQNGTAAGQTAYWNGTAWTIDNNIYNNGSDVGIGVPSPSSKLHVSDRVELSRMGLVGTYNSAQVQQIWSIGRSYNIDVTNNDFGTSYGIVYAHTNAGSGAKKPIDGWGHQILFTTSGTPKASISLTSGNAYFAGNVGIGTTDPSAKVELLSGALGSTSGNVSEMMRMTGDNGNANYLDFRHIRTSAGSNWNSAGTRIQQKIDATWMGYMQFNGDGNNYGISFGTGSTTTAPGNVPERMRIASNGTVTVNSLAGGGTSTVYADNNGALTKTPPAGAPSGQCYTRWGTWGCATGYTEVIQGRTGGEESYQENGGYAAANLECISTSATVNQTWSSGYSTRLMRSDAEGDGMSHVDSKCSICCSGGCYTALGVSTCASGYTATYTGRIGGLESYTNGSGYRGKTLCIDGAASSRTTWVNGYYTRLMRHRTNDRDDQGMERVNGVCAVCCK